MKEFFPPSELTKIKAWQRLAYQCAEEVAHTLKPGMSEILAADMLTQKLQKHGVKNWFHRPFAWFGERTRFQHFTLPLKFHSQDNTPFKNWKEKYAAAYKHSTLPHLGMEFLPTQKVLEENMVVILDAAPINDDGMAVDIGYTHIQGHHPQAEAARKSLLQHRDLILKMLREQQTMADIYHACDQLMAEQGLENCHRIYPFAVLGHRLGKIAQPPLPSQLHLGGFGMGTLYYFAKNSLMKLFSQDGHLWHGQANYRPSPGLWAIEPHLGGNGFGVKFEEILVVEENNAYWLDDNLPHLALAP